MPYLYGQPNSPGTYYGDTDTDRGTGAMQQPQGAAPATIVVRLPADARLMIDGNSTRSTESMRTFVSPPLQPGKSYTYRLTAEMTRDGRKVERSKEVTVRAGEQSQVDFDMSGQRDYD
jgi:uncharacterized protein (TIGR03000 family)